MEQQYYPNMRRGDTRYPPPGFNDGGYPPGQPVDDLKMIGDRYCTPGIPSGGMPPGAMPPGGMVPVGHMAGYGTQRRDVMMSQRFREGYGETIN